MRSTFRSTRFERRAAAESIPVRQRWGGVGFALVAAACQAGGLLLSKQGMGHGWLAREQYLDPQAATLVRMVFAAIAVVPMGVYQWRRTRRRNLANPPMVSQRGTIGRGIGLALCGSVVGPFLGVWLSLVSSDHAPLGVAQTLCSLAPVFLIPAVRFIHRERVSMRAIIGAVVAVGGSTLLFLLG